MFKADLKIWNPYHGRYIPCLYCFPYSDQLPILALGIKVL